jgi:S-adenosylmethionine hydrolase
MRMTASGQVPDLGAPSEFSKVPGGGTVSVAARQQQLLFFGLQMHWAVMLAPNARLAAAGRLLERERTFSDRPPGAAFWYENSNGLAEIAVNQGRADRDLGLAIGIPVEIVS